MAVTKVIGFEELSKNLLSLPNKVATRVLARSVYAGAAIVRNEARARVRKRTRKLQKSIKIYSKRTGKKWLKIYEVGSKLPYAHLVERGTAPHVIVPDRKKVLGVRGEFGIKVDHPGSRAYPFINPALTEKQNEAIDAMRVKMAEGIEREAVR